ncbi:MAG: DNA primase [Candidatus Aenigmarchaeota archaeon]|nr:DNA primase [Candidatus Aenigmarchaeota archaeon]
MVKLAQSTIKYLIEAEFETEGLVEKPDIIGAIFGQTEGLLGSDLELRELQRTGRIGRIDVDVSSSNGKSSGRISIPTSLDNSETALIAAALETIERIGPCESVVKLMALKDVRSIKREFVMDRAKEIMQWLAGESAPNSINMSETIKESFRTAQLQHYDGLPCGPDTLGSDEIIIVEGRADVINLLKNGIKNAIAMDGNRIPNAIIRLSKEKLTTLFVDGDRGGELIIKEFLQIGELDYVVQAPQGKEVEDLTKKEIFKTLREKQTIEEYKSQPKARELKEFLFPQTAP